MIDLTDGLLNAFLDDELDPQTRAAVERALQNNHGAQARLERMRANDAALKEAYALPVTSENDPLALAILSAEHLEVAPKRRAPWRAAAFGAAIAVAAGVFGIAIGRLTVPDIATYPVRSAAEIMSADVQEALSRNRSGTVDARTQLTVALSFKTQSGAYCRQFSSPDGEGLACRQENAWKLEAWDASARSEAGGYRMAGVSSVIDDAVDRLSGAPLESAQEKALIEKNWR